MYEWSRFSSVKALVLHGPRDLRRATLRRPEPQPGEVLVRVGMAGLCGTDYGIWTGDRPVSYPRVLGHEFSGRVEAVGAGVARVGVGERVVVEPNYSCGTCALCREGNRNPNLAPAEVFPTSDGYLALVAMNPRQWERTCQVLGDEVLRTEPRFATNRDRLANRDEMAARMETTLAGAPTAEWVAKFEAAGVPCGPVYEFDRLFADPQVQAAGLVSEFEQPDYGPVRLLNTPFRSSVWPVPNYQPAPRLGQHTAQVLEELGLARAEIDRLAASGAIGLGP